MVALTLASVLPFVWRGVGRELGHAGARRRAWRTTWLLAALLPAFAFGFHALRGDLAALGAERAALSAQLLQDGLPAAGDVSARVYGELQRHLQKQPHDPRALVLKARLDMREQRFAEAAAAFERAVAGRSKAAKDAGVWVEYAEASAMAQGGTLAGAPQQLLLKALRLDARHPEALDLAGSAAWEVRDFANAVLYWQRLLVQTPPGQARHAELAAAIERAQRLARLALPATP